MPTIPRATVGGSYVPATPPPANCLGMVYQPATQDFLYRTEADFWNASGPELSMGGAYSITNLYSGPGLNVGSKYFGAHFHNYPNYYPYSRRKNKIDGSWITDEGYRIDIMRTHDHSPNGLGSLRWQGLQPTQGNWVDTNLLHWFNYWKGLGKETLWTSGFIADWMSSVAGYSGSDKIYASTGVKASNPPDTAQITIDIVNHVLNTLGLGMVDYIEAWNEGNATVRWFNGTPEQYVQLILKPIWDTAKAFDANIKIVVPGLANYTSSNRAWLDSVLTASDGALGVGADYVDIISLHNYHNSTNASLGTFSTAAADYAAVKALMTSRGIGDKDIWMTEGGAGDLTLASHDHNMKRWYRWWLFYAGVGVKRCFYYSIDHDQFGIGSLWTPAFFKQLWAEMVTMLTDGSITRINQLWDGRIAYIRNGQRFIV